MFLKNKRILLVKLKSRFIRITKLYYSALSKTYRISISLGFSRLYDVRGYLKLCFCIELMTKAD